MKRELLRSSAFVRAARTLVKGNPGVADDLRATLELLSEDAFHPHLRTHKHPVFAPQPALERLRVARRQREGGHLGVPLGRIGADFLQPGRISGELPHTAEQLAVQSLSEEPAAVEMTDR